MILSNPLKFKAMKKKVLTVLTLGLFLSAIFFSLPRVKAEVVEVVGTRKTINALCSDGTTVITVCGQGTDYCTPSGTCP